MPRRPAHFLLAALCCVLAFAVLLAVAYGSDQARSVDSRALQGFFDLQRPGVAGPVERVAVLGNAIPVGIFTALLAGVALLRGRPRLAVAVVALLGLTSVSSQVLKALLAYPRFNGTLQTGFVSTEAFPSGHATAAMSIALAALLVVPARARPLAAVVGMGFALAVSFCVVILGSHFPSDVLGGFLLAAFWALVVAAAVLAASARWPERAGRTRLTASLGRAADAAATLGTAALAALVLGLAVVVAGSLVLTRGDELAAFAGAHTAVVAVAAAIFLAAAGVLGGLTLGLRRS